MGNCIMEKDRNFPYQSNADIQCSDIKTLYEEAKQLFRQDDKIIVTPIKKISHNMYLKLENMQISGSFKYRGAYLYLQSIYSDKVIIANSGNFAKACDLAHQKIMKERELRHQPSNFIMPNGQLKDQKLDNNKNIQKQEKKYTESISENVQYEKIVIDQCLRQISNDSDTNQKYGQNFSEIKSLSYEQQEFDQRDENNFRFSPFQSINFDNDRKLNNQSIIQSNNNCETHPDLKDNQIEEHQQSYKDPFENSIQFHSKNQDMKNENIKQLNNPLYLNQKSPINQEYETPTPIDDATVQQNNQQKQQESEPFKESAKEFVKLQIDKTGSQLIIVVPETVKQEKIKDIKSQIVKYGKDSVECEVQARQYANQNHGFRYFSPYNDIYMIAGNATIGYELAEQLAEVSRQADYLFVAVGGGGLISGIAFYFKVIREQKIKIIGVQPQKNCAMYNIVNGKNNILEDTVCDATAGGVELNAITIQICKHLVDEWVLIKEQDILKGQEKLWNDHKIVVEASAAMAFVACENYQKVNKKIYVALLCGGNVYN